MKKRNHLEQKRLNDLVFTQYNLRLRRNQLLNKISDTYPIVLDDADPTSDWVVETHPPMFDVDFDMDVDDAGEVDLEANPLVGPYDDASVGSIPNMASPSTSRAQVQCNRRHIPHVPPRGSQPSTTASTTTTIANLVTDVPDESSKFESQS